jgi:hypothetical protein
MNKFLLSLIVSSLLFVQPVASCAQFGGKAGMGGKAGTGGGPSASCTPPTTQFTGIMPAYQLTGNPYCNGSSACTTAGASVYTVPEIVASNNAVWSTSSTAALYQPAQINSLAAVQIPTNVFSTYSLTTPIPGSQAGYTFAGLIYITASSGEGIDLIGGSTGLQFFVNNNFPTLAYSGTGIGSTFGGGGALAAGWSGIVATYVPSTGAWNIYVMPAASSTFTSWGSGTDAVTVSSTSAEILNFSGNNTSGQMEAELDWNAGTALSLTQINSYLAPWYACKYAQ